MSKTLRQFQCRDDLWARVEALAKRRGIAADDVVQAALLQLFKGAAKGKKDESSGMTDAPPAGPSTPARSVLSTQPGHPGAEADRFTQMPCPVRGVNGRIVGDQFAGTAGDVPGRGT